MASTPLRNVRVSDDLWGRARARAQADGTNVSTAVQWFLREYVEGRITPPRETPVTA